jgi:mRNA-degrading endonuclease RelE of RelBE toxin-antitoxin system
MSLTIELSPRAFRDLSSLEKHNAKEILNDLELLKIRPWPPAPKIKKLSGYKNLYRLRIGQYRAIYEAGEKNVIVHRIIDRKELERILKNL